MNRILFIVLLLSILFPEVVLANMTVDILGFTVSQAQLDRWLSLLRPLFLVVFWGTTLWLAVVGGIKLRILSCISCIVGFVVLLM